MLVRVEVPADTAARLERLRGSVSLATRRTALVAELVRLGLDAAEADPTRLVSQRANLVVPPGER